MSATDPSPRRTEALRTLARWRVPLGFGAGAAILWLAQPTRETLLSGAAIAVVGEALRVWAAGHLEKSREVTQSGPYRFLGHPLYAGTTLMAAGLAVASRHVGVAVLVAVYLVLTLGAAIRTEEAFLRERFGAEYEAYRTGRATGVHRRFSWARVRRNREYRAVAGLAAVLAVLWLKAL